MTKRFRRAPKDYSQRLRRAVQLGFLVLNVGIGIEFVLFVRYCESGGQAGRSYRPPGVEGWLPIASLMNLKVFAETGYVPRVHPAGMFLLSSFLLISWLLRKSFCSWLCPVGTLSEDLWRLGRSTFRKNWRLPRVLDIPLRALKYALLALFVHAIAGMPAAAIRAFLEGPYGLVADVKLLNFFRFMNMGSAITVGLLALVSVFVQNFWCRYLCPYGALVGLFSLASPVRIRRSAALCIDCAKCARDCPAQLPVDRLVAIRSAECNACMQCLAACPAAGALELSVAKHRISAWMVTAVIAIVFFGVCGWAQWTGHWHTDLPARVYLELVPRANEFRHP